MLFGTHFIRVSCTIAIENEIKLNTTHHGDFFVCNRWLQDGFVEPEFQRRLVEHFSFVSVACDQTIDFDRFQLANTVTASLGLQRDDLCR